MEPFNETVRILAVKSGNTLDPRTPRITETDRRSSDNATSWWPSGASVLSTGVNENGWRPVPKVWKCLTLIGGLEYKSEELEQNENWLRRQMTLGILFFTNVGFPSATSMHQK